jgi:hypothetical protein
LNHLPTRRSLYRYHSSTSYTRNFLQKPLFYSIQGISTRIEEYIVDKAEGVFLWVSLIAVRLESFLKKGSTPAKVLKELESLPTEIESYYKILEELVHGDQEDISYGKRILQFCLFSHRSIQLIELDHALAISEELGPPEHPRTHFTILHLVPSTDSVKNSGTARTETT